MNVSDLVVHCASSSITERVRPQSRTWEGRQVPSANALIDKVPPWP